MDSAQAGSAGGVTITCPICRRLVTFPTSVTTTHPASNGDTVCRIHLDMHAVTAHLLSHDQYDGEPSRLAA